MGEAAGTMTDCSVSGVLSGHHAGGLAQSRLGGLVGYLDGGVIESSKVFNFEILESDDNYYSGGLVGRSYQGRISSSSVEDSKIYARTYSGGLVGYSFGTPSSIENSYTLNTTVEGTASGAVAGGLAGFSGTVEITGSHVKNGAVTAVNGDSHAGGILGNATGTPSIINSFVKNVDVSGSGYAGGIVGVGNAGFYSSYVDSTSSVLGASAGGLIGFSSNGHIIYSYSHAPVQGSRRIGSVAGRIHVTEINRSYGAGSLSATSGTNPTIGGLVGSSQSSHIHDSFWDTETTSQANSAPGGPGGTDHGGPFTGPGSALGTNDIKTDCAEGATDGICKLGSAFVYKQGSYPKLKECIENCSHSNILEQVHGEALLDGQDESLY